MKAIVLDRNGGPEVLVSREIPRPEPGAGEALVRLEAIGINYIDVYYRTGAYPAPKFPFVLGQEAAGVVESVGDGVTTLRVGDRVAYQGITGSYAEYAVVPAARLVSVPDDVTTRAAAAIMLQGMTAHYLVNSTFALKAGDVALVHAGAGGVGLLLTQLAKAKGARVIATVSTAEKAELSRRAGADLVVRYTSQDFVAEARAFTAGRGVDVAYDSVGKTTWQGSIDSLRPRGSFVLFGASSGPMPPLDFQVLNAKGSLFATRPSLIHYVATREELTERAASLFANVLAGELELRIEHTYPLADAARAHIDLQARATTGKILLLP